MAFLLSFDKDPRSNKMSKIVKKMLYAGPMEGHVIEIHEDNLKIRPIINVTDDKGQTFVYGLQNDEFIWMSDPDGAPVTSGWFVCDDDGNVISEEQTEEDAKKRLDAFNKEQFPED